MRTPFTGPFSSVEMRTPLKGPDCSPQAETHKISPHVNKAAVSFTETDKHSVGLPHQVYFLLRINSYNKQGRAFYPLTLSRHTDTISRKAKQKQKNGRQTKPAGTHTGTLRGREAMNKLMSTHLPTHTHTHTQCLEPSHTTDFIKHYGGLPHTCTNGWFTRHLHTF